MSYDIERIFVVMMENRSFDHMLGHLHAHDPRIDGIRRSDATWLSRWANDWSGHSYPPRQAFDPGATIAVDPPHGRKAIETQIGTYSDGGYPMDGFVSTYAQIEETPTVDPATPPPPMGWFDGSDVPVYDFLARNFAVCNRWFCSLPAGTQPNRLMAMSGSTKRDDNHFPLPNQRIVYDWLNERNIRWRVYHDGLPFFAMMPKWARPAATSKKFRSFDRMQADVMNEAPGTFPQVIFIEPTYADAPHSGASNDDHAPAGVTNGQAFIRKVYNNITRNRAIFDKSVTIITYDEHGGFFDHVSPPRIRTDPPAGAGYTPFASLGVRVPALIVSPYVEAGTVSDIVYDHTSMLKLLGEIFGNGWGYEHPVNSRPVGDILDMLNKPEGRPPPAMPQLHAGLAMAGAKSLKTAVPDDATENGRVPGTAPANELQQGFQMALDEVRQLPPEQQGKFADLLSMFPPDPEIAVVKAAAVSETGED